MEFERALFRIHQKTLLAEPLRRVRIQLERILPGILAVQVLLLAWLHTSYVGRASCLPDVLQRAGLWNESASKPLLPEDAILYLTVNLGDGITGLTMVEASKGPTSGNQSSAAKRLEDSSDVLASYRFALDREIVQMRKSVFQKHNFAVHNVSLTQACLSTSTALADALNFFNSWDGLVINELAYSLRSRGYLERMDGEQVFLPTIPIESQNNDPNSPSIIP